MNAQVLAIPGALSGVDRASARKARSAAWQWLIDFPIDNNNWCGYCEDVNFGQYAWVDGVCDYDFIPQVATECSVAMGGNCDLDVDECISSLMCRRAVTMVV